MLSVMECNFCGSVVVVNETIGLIVVVALGAVGFAAL